MHKTNAEKGVYMKAAVLGISLFLFLGLTAPGANAQTVPPRGLYCSCPPTSSRSHSVMPEVASQDFVTGILVRVAWSDLEPVEGAPTWTLLDNELALAKQYGKKVALAVVNGSSAPAWLAAKGAQMFAYSFRGSSMTMPVPWDSVYLSAWTNFIAKLGERYRDDPSIALVHMTHSTLNGFEM